MKQVLAFLLVILVFLLPIQSLIGVFAVNKLGLPILSLLWKEIVEGVIMGILLIQIFQKIQTLSRIKMLQNIWPIIVVGLLSLYGIGVSLGKISAQNIIYGFRFELFWLWFFAVLLTWYKLIDLEILEYVRLKIKTAIMYGFAPVILVSYTTLIFGQERVLGSLGFGMSNSKMLADIPVSHLVDGGGWSDLLRLSGTFTTPNHFAGYLLLILPFFAYYSINEKKKQRKYWFIFGLSNILLFIALSFARYAWLALISWVFVLGSYYLIKNLNGKKIVYGLALAVPLFIGIIAINLPEEFLQRSVPSFIAKPSSTVFHARRTFASISVLTHNPAQFWTGYGLGASGPAAKQEYTDVLQNPLYKSNIQTALDYYLEPKEIVIPENWFIQLILNGGIVYSILYTFIALFPLFVLSKKLFSKSPKMYEFDAYIALGFYSIIIGNLFLHLWENQTIAVYYSILILFMYKEKAIKSSAKLTTI